jgi:glycine/sarcosine N-methyltransferase
MSPSAVEDFYDGFADEYHLVYGDQWESALKRQGVVLDGVIRDALDSAQPARVLDCSCGIGTQALGLALQGYRVTGTDLSTRSVERARVEAARLGVAVEFAVADFRDLSGVPGPFDVVISCDNALPHLLEHADVLKALKEMRAQLEPGGLLVLGIRDYDRALVERPASSPPLVVFGPPRQLIVRYHDWDADGPCYTVHFFILTEAAAGWTTQHHATRYRALSKDTLQQAVSAAGFTDAHWHEELGFHQPLLTARAV